MPYSSINFLINSKLKFLMAIVKIVAILPTILENNENDILK
jgi:hypothetical protein